LKDGGDSRPERLLYFWNYLGAYLTETRVDMIFHEAPLNIAVMSQIGATDDVVQMLRSLIGVLELAAAAHQIPIKSWRVQEARQAVLGRGRFKRGESKKEVMKYVRMLGFEPDDDNVADGIVGWLHQSALLNPRTAHLSAPLFGRRAWTMSEEMARTTRSTSLEQILTIEGYAEGWKCGKRRRQRKVNRWA